MIFHNFWQSFYRLTEMSTRVNLDIRNSSRFNPDIRNSTKVNPDISSHTKMAIINSFEDPGRRPSAISRRSEGTGRCSSPLGHLLTGTR